MEAFFVERIFDFVEGIQEREFFKNAYWAITATDMWTWLSTFNPSNNEGFIFCNDENLKIIENKMFEQDIAKAHSGFSFAYTMRNMKFIAINGYDAFRILWLNNNTTRNYISG